MFWDTSVVLLLPLGYKFCYYQNKVKKNTGLCNLNARYSPPEFIWNSENWKYINWCFQLRCSSHTTMSLPAEPLLRDEFLMHIIAVCIKKNALYVIMWELGSDLIESKELFCFICYLKKQ